MLVTDSVYCSFPALPQCLSQVCRATLSRSLVHLPVPSVSESTKLTLLQDLLDRAGVFHSTAECFTSPPVHLHCIFPSVPCFSFSVCMAVSLRGWQGALGSSWQAASSADPWHKSMDLSNPPNQRITCQRWIYYYPEIITLFSKLTPSYRLSPGEPAVCIMPDWQNSGLRMCSNAVLA